jgi:hypothetical protein
MVLLIVSCPGSKPGIGISCGVRNTTVTPVAEFAVPSGELAALSVAELTATGALVVTVDPVPHVVTPLATFGIILS